MTAYSTAAKTIASIPRKFYSERLAIAHRHVGCAPWAKSAVYDCLVSARCNIGLYISRLCHDASPYVRLSVTEVHWRIIANLGFKFRSHFTAHWLPCCCGRRAAGRRRAACGRIITRHASQC